MHSLLVKLCGCGLLVILFQKEGQCATEIISVAVGQNFSLQTDVGFMAQWYGTISGQKRILASCDSDGCRNFKTGFIASVRNVTRNLKVTWHKYVLQVINVSPTLTRIDNLGYTWDIVFIGNEVSTLTPGPFIRTTALFATPATPVYMTTSFWTTTPAPCFLCSNDSPTTYGSGEQYTRSSSPLVYGLSIGVPCLIVITTCISLLCCIAKRKRAAGTLGPVSPQPGVASRPYIVQANDTLPPVYDQILVYGVSLPINQVPTAPQLLQEYGSPPDYESLPPSYESVVHFYKPNNNGVIKYIPDPST